MVSKRLLSLIKAMKEKTSVGRAALSLPFPWIIHGRRRLEGRPPYIVFCGLDGFAGIQQPLCLEIGMDAVLVTYNLQIACTVNVAL